MGDDCSQKSPHELTTEQPEIKDTTNQMPKPTANVTVTPSPSNSHSNNYTFLMKTEIKDYGLPKSISMIKI